MDVYLQETRNLLWIGSILYGLAFCLVLGSLLLERQHNKLVFYTLLTGGFLIQGMGLYLRGLAFSSLPLSNPTEVLQVIAWSLCLLVLLVQISFPLSLLSFFGAGMGALLSFLSLSVKHWDYNHGHKGVLENPWIDFHAGLAIFAYGVFGILSIVALMYILQHNGLTKKRFGGIFNSLPSLQQLDKLLSSLLLTGLVIYTVALLLGTLTWLSGYKNMDSPTLLFSWALWLCYFGILLLKEKKRWITRKISWGVLGLFTFSVISLWLVHT